jgi:hypothetical protein
MNVFKAFIGFLFLVAFAVLLRFLKSWKISNTTEFGTAYSQATAHRFCNISCAGLPGAPVSRLYA